GDGVLPPGVVAVVGGEQRGPDPAGDVEQLRVGLALLLEAMVLQLDEELVAAEDVLEPRRGGARRLEVAPQEVLENHATEAASRGDDPLVPAGHQLPVDP